MARDLNPRLLAVLTELAGKAPEAPRCPECGDVAGDGIDCRACRAIRGARHGRDRDEQVAYDRARQTHPIDATPVRDWRRHLTLGDEGGGNEKEIDMGRLPSGKMLPLRTGPAVGQGRCPNPRNNPKCRGTATAGKLLCLSCAMREAHARRREGGVAASAEPVPDALPPSHAPPPAASALVARPAAAPAALEPETGSPGPLTTAVADFMAAAFRAAARVEAKMTADRADGCLAIEVKLYGQK